MFPILFEVGGFKLASYGVFVALGYLSSILILRAWRERMGLDEERFWSLIYALFLGALLGSKLLYMAVEWRRFASGELGLLRDLRYGFVYFGGVMGALAGFAWSARRLKLDAPRLGDYLAAAAPVGHAIGRLGCLAAGCCHGKASTLPWAVSFTDPQCLVGPGLLGVPLHPTQLYEAAGSLAIAGLLTLALGPIERGDWRRGTALWGYFALYGALRFGVECLRGDDRGGFLMGLSPSQWIALAAVAVGTVLLWRRGVRAAAA